MPKKSLAERKAELEKRRQQLTARLQKLDAQAKLQERKRDARQKIVVGAAVIAHAKIDAAFADLLITVLNKAVTRPIDREVITGLLKAGATTRG